MHHLESKVESYVYRCLNFQMNYEVAPAVRPILSVDMLTTEELLSCLLRDKSIHPVASRTQKFP